VKTVCRVFAFLALISFCPFSSAVAFEGPLQVRNLFPIFLHLDQPYLEEAAMKNSLSFSLSHSSTYTVQSSGHWIINLDMEITEFNIRYKKIIKDFFEFNVDVPVLIIGGGFLDEPLADYHDAFNFKDYGRSARPHNSFLYEVRRDGALIIQGKSGVRLGDIRLAVKKSLLEIDGMTLSAGGNVEIPVSNAKKGFSNGNLDGSVYVLLDLGIGDTIMTYWNFGAVFTGDVEGYQTLAVDDFIYGGGGIEAAVGKGFSLLVQVLGQTSIYPATDLGAVDDDAYLISFGGRYQNRRGIVELSLTEDLSTAGAPDFILNASWKILM
jgi:hypothetical protein